MARGSILFLKSISQKKVDCLKGISRKEMDCRVISAFTRVFNALCPAMTSVGSALGVEKTKRRPRNVTGPAQISSTRCAKLTTFS
jgi:hypothetical protein